METKKRFEIAMTSDLAVVGYNPENADLDCPRGEIVRERYYFVATDVRGYRWAWGWFESPEIAEAALALAPSVALWEATRPAYGSEAYVAQGTAADDLEAERRMDEEALQGFDTRFARY